MIRFSLLEISLLVAGPAIDTRTSLSMTFNAPAHLHGGGSFNNRHLGNLPMAFMTRNASLYVPLMVKINVVRHHMNLDPGHRLATIKVPLQLLNLRRIGLYHLMATHTGLHLWDRRE